MLRHLWNVSVSVCVLTWGKGQAGKAGYSLKESFIWKAERASQLPAEHSPVPTYFTPQDQLWAPNASFFFFFVILHTPHDFTNQAGNFALQLQDESALAQNVLTSNFGFGLTFAFVYVLKALSVPHSSMPCGEWLSPWPGQPFGSACVSLMTGKCTCGRDQGKHLG